jgi:hypothetical protein
MIVAVTEPELEFTGNFGWMNDGGSGWNLTSDTLSLSAAKIEVKASIDGIYHVTLLKYSCGRSSEDAKTRAEQIIYSVSSKDSILDLGNGFAVYKDSKYRGQNIEIEIQVPPGKKIRFDESVNEKLNAVDVKIDRGRRRGRVSGFEINNNYRDFQYRSGVDYTMGTDNILRDPEGNVPSYIRKVTTTTTVNGTVIEKTTDYRYDAKDSVTKQVDPETQRKIDEINRKEQERKEQRRKEDEQLEKDKRELLEKQNKPTVFVKEKTNNEEGSYVGGPSAVSSMSQWF